MASKDYSKEAVKRYISISVTALVLVVIVIIIRGNLPAAGSSEDVASSLLTRSKAFDREDTRGARSFCSELQGYPGAEWRDCSGRV